MQILALAVLVAVVWMMDIQPAETLRPALLPLVALYVAGSYLLARLEERRGRIRLMRGIEQPSPLWGFLNQFYLLGGIVALMAAGWGGWIDSTLHIGKVPLIGQALAYTPFVLAAVLHWYGIYGLDQAMRMRHRAEMVLLDQISLPSWTRRQFVMFNLRQNLLFVALPGALLVLSMGLLQLAGNLIPAVWSEIASLLVAGGIFLFAPAMLVRVWRTSSLPEGEIRDHLSRLCRDLKLKFRDIRVWQTDSVVTNAGVLGLVGPVRYVLLSDALLKFMPPEAVEAVFMHEAGHVVHRHILTMVVFTFGLGGLFTSAGQLIDMALKLSDQHSQYFEGFCLAATAIVWLLMFGKLSKLLERQADVFAACHCLDRWYDRPMLAPERVALFNRSLLMVARLNGMGASARNFRHGSIQSRVDYLTGLVESGQDERQVNNQVRRIKRLCWALLAAGVAASVVVALL